MADFDSSLPVRTQTNGDIVAKLSDGTINTQLLGIDSSGRVTIKLQDGAGNAVTSQINGTQRALDIGINVAGVQIDPRQIRALTAADVVTANQGSAGSAAAAWFIKNTDGTNVAAVKAASTAALAADPSLVVALSPNSPLPTGSNVIGSVNQGTSPWITRDQSDGSVTGGTAGTFSSLGGGLYNTALPTLTNGQQAAFQLDSSGRLIISPSAGGSISVTNFPSTVDTNYGTVSASTIRTAAQLGNSTGAANFNNGATGAQTLRVAANLAVAGADVTIANPVPVFISQDNPGIEINDYNSAVAVAAGATSNHDYTVSATKTLLLTQITAAASGKMKIEVQIETGAATGVFTSKFVQFNSTAEPNIGISLRAPITVATGVRVRIIRTNTDLLAQNLYSTISGQEN